MDNTLVDGSNPRMLICSMCGTLCLPKYEGWWASSVCSAACYDERQRRYAFQILRVPYTNKKPEEKPEEKTT